jgi:hypothetical protein
MYLVYLDLNVARNRDATMTVPHRSPAQSVNALPKTGPNGNRSIQNRPKRYTEKKRCLTKSSGFRVNIMYSKCYRGIARNP